MKDSAGFRVVELDEPSCHCGGMVLFYRGLLRFAVESHQQHVLNVARFQLEEGGRHWYIVVCYLAPGEKYTTECAFTSIYQKYCGMELLVAREINANLSYS